MVVPSMKNLSVPRTVVSHRAGGREKLEKVFGGLRGELFGRNATELGEEFTGEHSVGGLVALAAQGAGREERSVGFDEDAIGRCGAGDVLDGRGLRIGHVSGEGEIE